VVAVLKEALGGSWVVERETDCTGEVSIIAFPVGENEGTPSFILFESEGRARLATISSDEWNGDRAFDSFPEAVSAFITEALAYQPAILNSAFADIFGVSALCRGGLNAGR
jgi:hypothetical protein